MATVSKQEQISQFKDQVSEFSSLVVKIEALEKELNMIDEESTNNKHDVDLQEEQQTLTKAVAQSAVTLQKLKQAQADKVKQELEEQKKKEELIETQDDAPKGFDWDQLSEDIEI